MNDSAGVSGWLQKIGRPGWIRWAGSWMTDEWMDGKRKEKDVERRKRAMRSCVCYTMGFTCLNSFTLNNVLLPNSYDW